MYMNDGIKTKINLRNKSVFITGVAGFIGSNLAKRLLSTVEGVKVVGLDNMNHYYDVRLKEARLNELEQFDNYRRKSADWWFVLVSFGHYLLLIGAVQGQWYPPRTDGNDPYSKGSGKSVCWRFLRQTRPEL